ncbi:hypothetical protein C7441_10451 [Pseudaminobacter salicylatoxidans]|uniref:Uncharacterized protein n=2 Tax=Pseudaminobacter salicylatoxidans TaxID=93369 RepID=A0A316C4W0_PSESE|nr:hypothetical protein C7441_10451 [Pseudaminobacter salicylatoxidans]
MSPVIRPTVLGGLVEMFSLLAGHAAFAQETATAHPAAIEHLPFFITAPGQTDVLFVVVAIFLVAMILIIGNLYFQLHALPERVAHRTSKVQLEIVAVLALLALFTHNHLYWIAALLLALVRLPDLSTPMASMADSLKKLADRADALRSERNSPAGTARAPDAPEARAAGEDIQDNTAAPAAETPKDGN